VLSALQIQKIQPAAIMSLTYQQKAHAQYNTCITINALLHVSAPTTPSSGFMIQSVISSHIQDVQLKSGSYSNTINLFLRFTTCYITQLTCIYSKCLKLCPFISMHLSTRFTIFLATFLRVLSFTSSTARVIFIFKILNFSKNFVYSGRKTSFLNNFPK
jgi:hypothetical protein